MFVCFCAEHQHTSKSPCCAKDLGADGELEAKLVLVRAGLLHVQLCGAGDGHLVVELLDVGKGDSVVAAHGALEGRVRGHVAGAAKAKVPGTRAARVVKGACHCGAVAHNLVVASVHLVELVLAVVVEVCE